jgi:hypothetical protein
MARDRLMHIKPNLQRMRTMFFAARHKNRKDIALQTHIKPSSLL